MWFNSLEFALFFTCVYLAVLLSRKRVTLRNAVLLAASYLFYAAWDYRFLSLIIISSLVDYACARGIGRQTADERRTVRERLLLLVSILTNIGLLATFKYFDFFVDNAAALLAQAGIILDYPTLNIVLPVGVSFYTFQTLSYTIDVYHGTIRPERNLLTFALFVAFFPQLVAGPIERAGNLIPQLRRHLEINWSRLQSGFFLIAWGACKKVIVADNIAKVVDAVFAHECPRGLDVLLGSYAFAIQIYADFSGYSDIARGVARCLGVNLQSNFHLPFLATSVSDFWRRWHITLSQWLRDYVYLPLRGNRFSQFSAIAAIILTFALCGLWHGAAWTFVVFGLLHGTAVSLERLGGRWLPHHPYRQTPPTSLAWFLRVLWTFNFFALSLVFFRAHSIAHAGNMLRALLFDFSATRAVVHTELLALFLVLFIMVVATQLIQARTRHEFVPQLGLVPRVACYLGMMLAFIFFGEYGGEAFIYFQF